VSVVGEPQRAAIETRAARRCKYWHLPTEGQVARFPMDHITPRSAGGLTEMENLALICRHCNGHKWAHVDGVDSSTGKTVLLFNPRTQAWADHFQWSKEDGITLHGKTPCGRATIARLQMNHSSMSAVRQMLVELGILGENQQAS
jgi:hypothetical protein